MLHKVAPCLGRASNKREEGLRSSLSPQDLCFGCHPILGQVQRPAKAATEGKPSMMQEVPTALACPGHVEPCHIVSRNGRAPGLSWKEPMDDGDVIPPFSSAKSAAPTSRMHCCLALLCHVLHAPRRTDDGKDAATTVHDQWQAGPPPASAPAPRVTAIQRRTLRCRIRE